MTSGGAIVFIVVVGLIIALIVWVIIAVANNDDDSNESSNSDDNGNNGNDQNAAVCDDITNVINGKPLTNVRVYLRGHTNQILSPSAIDSNGLCHLGNTSQPLSVVACKEEPEYNWTFDDKGYLQYTNGDIFSASNLGGIDNKYYLTYSYPQEGDTDNTIEAWYGVEQAKGDIYPATMTILPVNTNDGCLPQLCVSYSVITGHITTNIKGKTYYLTANKANSFVFWYDSCYDECYTDRQLWSIDFDHTIKIGGDCEKQEENHDCKKVPHTPSDHATTKRRRKRNKHKK